MEINNPIINNIEVANMKNSEFEKLSNFIYSNYGIKMPPEKKIMLQSRLLKRLRALNINNFKDYIEYAFHKDNEAEEITRMMNIVSTNKTDFYREPVHFQFLSDVILPSLKEEFISNKTFKVWSAGSSSGEEAYTIAITIEEWIKTNKWINYFIFGSDISTAMLKKATEGIYNEDRIYEIPLSIKKKYFLRSKDKTKKLVRVVPEIRSKTKFFRLNFMDNYYPVNEKFNVIFCRNTLIYFDSKTQNEVLLKLSKHLKKDGYLFIGHSESILNRDTPFRQIKPTIYKLKQQ